MTRRKHASKELRPVRLSQEHRTLSQFFPEGTGRLEGILEAGLLGPGAPETREDGEFESKWIMGGVFCILTWDVDLYEEGAKTGQSQGHCIIGWDAHAAEYRMLRAANLGVLHQLNGRLKGKELVFTSDVNKIKGRPTRVRYSFRRKQPEAVIWTAEMSVEGKPWQLVGKDTLTYV
jgi:hypothetical protein